MRNDLVREGVFLDGEYYCLHHPEAKVEKLRVNCECRKPRPGMLLQAAQEMNVDLSQSWLIGDGLTDIKAGKLAGTRTMLIGTMKCELCKLMHEDDAHPDFIAANLLEAAQKVGEVQSPRSKVKELAVSNPKPKTSDIGPRTSEIGPRPLKKAIDRFQDIEAWKEARKLVNAIYDVSDREPLSKDFSLRNQIRGASVSIMSNIAEGFDRNSDKEFIQFLVIARASASEVKSQLYVALDRGYIERGDFKAISEQTNSVTNLINGFIRYLRKPRPRTSDIGPMTLG